MTIQVFRDTRAWAEAIAALPAPGPLPARTVLVPRERVAHSLRRELIRGGQAAALAGTRFLPPAAAALAVIETAGVRVATGEEALRAPRLLALFRSDLPLLRHFPAELLRMRPGWDQAFARTIGDLEDASLRPEDVDARAAGLGAPDAARLADVAAVWRALDAAAGASWTRARIYLEAAQRLESDPQRWPLAGATLATVTGHIRGAMTRFVRAIPGVCLALLAGRPLREPFASRVRALGGDAAAQALETVTAPPPGSSERDILAAYLFTPPAVLADPARPRSRGPDGTVDIEEHAGLEEEIEAAADWVARQALDGIALEDIAVLVPTLDPLASLVAQRLARLPWPQTGEDGALPVHVAGGLPLTETAAGARTLALLRALRGHLSGGALAEVLPSLRTSSAEGRRLSHGAAMSLVWSLGTAGGHPARPEGAREWAQRAAERQVELATQLAQVRAAPGGPEHGDAGRNARDLERRLQDLQDIGPALVALDEIAGRVMARAPLAELWPALRAFLARWLRQPGDGPRLETILDERLGTLIADGACGRLGGDDALRTIEDALGAIRTAAGRFGDPAVYVGTLAGAAGLRFRAVRVLGLAEGHFPAVTREDPVIPDALRAHLDAASAPAPLTAADRALASLHALDRVVRDTEHRLALCAPRLDGDRSVREPSSVMLEALAALGRPKATTGAPGPVIPDAATLARDAFRPARRGARAFRHGMPLGDPAWQDAVAAREFNVPMAWRLRAAIDPERVRQLGSGPTADALDGILDPEGVGGNVPGLDPARPISASGLQTLLQCPYKFLLHRMLGLQEPAGAPTLREIGQPDYGALAHLAIEGFYGDHGARFCAQDGKLETWTVRAEETLDRVLADFLREYPLVGEAVRGRQRERLRQDVCALLRADWAAGPRQFVAVERGFGRPVPLALPAGERLLHVRGQIDRLDVEVGVTLVRDLKTGRPRPRAGSDAQPLPVVDVQLAVYGLVARQLAAAWEIPDRIAAAYVYVAHAGEERSWRHDFDETLVPAAAQWLQVAAGLLAERSFPRTPDVNDCTYCHFRPACGEDAPERAARVLAGATGPLAGFRALKGVV